MTEFRLPHIASRIFDAPLLIAPDKARVIIAALAPRFGFDEGAPPAPRAVAPVVRRAARDRRPYRVEQGIALIDIEGTLCQRGINVDAQSGLTSCERLEYELANALADPDVRGILFDIDSHGGEVHGIADLARRIHEARAVKPVHAIANETALSGAYWLAAAAERITMAETGYVGSIGVYTYHVDATAYEQGEGFKITEVYAGAQKCELSPHRVLGEDARGRLQDKVDRLYEQFVGAVAFYRGRDATAMAATEAGVFDADRAGLLGLVDAIGTAEDAFNVLQAATRSMPMSTITKPVPPAAASALAAKPKIKMTAERLAKKYPKSIAAIRRATAAGARIEGATAERMRILDIQKAALPGHGELVAKLAADPQVDVGQAARMILAAEQEKGPRRLAALRAEDPTGLKPAVTSEDPAAAPTNLSVEDQARRDWEREPKTRAEFNDAFPAFLALRKAEAKGLVRRPGARAA